MKTPKTRLTPSIRRSADRPAIPGRQPTDQQIALVEAGILTRSNVKPGTRGAQAVYKVETTRRISRRKDGETISEALGHERPEVRERAQISVLFNRADPWTVLTEPTRLEKRRAGRYAHLQAELAAGRVSPRLFQRRVESWEPIRGERLLSNPEKVLAVLEARRAAEEPPFLYVSGRAA